ncbi:hypothetical protein GYMLUDRAFT_263088 [Collybiopsis luxurians FD-317 M1]|uniref:Histone-lysine N-methyltransferase SET5 n=1 Tax=Collybiopsis luxurians FD-317 M1 TaxID=944289 RepID=A0A0D0C582_9AGAR|nr:hypothetical protein GYMLUDRAFT_263088 [Collybiopsis luxurians FD-317 M1]
MASTPVSFSLSPSEKDLKGALISLKSTHPNCGILKIHALLLKAYPEWTIREKGRRKTLQSEGLVLQSSTEPSAKSANVFPSPKLIPNLDGANITRSWKSGISVKEGKGSRFQGENCCGRASLEGRSIYHCDGVAFPEADPLQGRSLNVPDTHADCPRSREIYDLQRMGQACSFCTTPFSSSTTTSLLTNCPASSSSSYCPARFCNRLCRDRSARTHPLLRRAQNPASVPLMTWVREAQWIALHALACMTGRVMILCQDPKVADEEWRIVSSFATLSTEDRAKYHYDSAEPDPKAWRKAFGLYMQVFKEPEAPIDQKKLARIIKKPKPDEAMSADLEAQGELYVLHSHLNHSCDPNVSIRHLNQYVVLSRITAIAKRDITPGEELSITYVDPVLPFRARQRELEGWGFGKCSCSRCLDEEKNLVDSDEKRDGGAGDQGDGLDMADLEKELKAGLGVM